MDAEAWAVLALWMLLGGIVATAASSKGRSGLGWWLYGFLLFPIALFHVLTLDSKRDGMNSLVSQLLAEAMSEPGLTVRQLSGRIGADLGEAVRAAHDIQDRRLARFEADDPVALERRFLADARVYPVVDED